MVEGEMSQREEEKISLKNQNFIRMCDLTFPHCVFLDLKEINIGKMKNESMIIFLNWVKNHGYKN